MKVNFKELLKVLTYIDMINEINFDELDLSDIKKLSDSEIKAYKYSEENISNIDIIKKIIKNKYDA